MCGIKFKTKLLYQCQPVSHGTPEYIYVGVYNIVVVVVVWESYVKLHQ